MEWTVGTTAESKVAFSDPRLQQAAWSCTGAPCTWGSMWVGTLSCNLSVPRVAAWQGKVCKSFPGSFLGPIAPPWTFSTFSGALVGWMGGAATLSSKSWLWVCPAVPNSAIWSLTKEPKNIHWKKSISLTKDAEETGYSHTKVVKIGPSCPVQKQIQYLAKPLM